MRLWSRVTPPDWRINSSCLHHPDDPSDPDSAKPPFLSRSESSSVSGAPEDCERRGSNGAALFYTPTSNAERRRALNAVCFCSFITAASLTPCTDSVSHAFPNQPLTSRRTTQRDCLPANVTLNEGHHKDISLYSETEEQIMGLFSCFNTVSERLYKFCLMETPCWLLYHCKTITIYIHICIHLYI